MKLVIDIPKDVKETLDRIESLSIKQLGDLQVAVMHGTPLPKGHGRLIILSEDAVKREQVFFGFSCQDWISDVGLSNATVAILEADGGDTDENRCNNML